MANPRDNAPYRLETGRSIQEIENDLATQLTRVILSWEKRIDQDRLTNALEDHPPGEV